MSKHLVPALGFQDVALQKYIMSVSHVKILSHEEENNLVERYYTNNDLEAGRELVVSHLPLVLKLAFGYKGYNISLVDIISEGNLGLLKALEKFDPKLGNRFATYASWWIKAHITDFILNSWSLVRVGTYSARKKLFFSLNRIKKKLKIESKDISSLEAQAISDVVEGVSSKDVVDINNMLNKTDLSISASVSKNLGSDNVEVESILPSLELNPEEEIANEQESIFYKQLIMEVYKNLNDREKTILEKRYLGDETLSLKEIADEIGISRERVRQLEQDIIAKIRKKLGAYLPAKSKDLLLDAS